MSDLIREARRNAKNWADKPESAAMWNRFADELERLTAILEYANNEIKDGNKRIKKLEKVLEAGIFPYMSAPESISNEWVLVKQRHLIKLDEAIADQRTEGEPDESIPD